MAEEQRLPIDIHTNKLLDWLISRRHCNKDWQSKALVIRDKIKRAILDMPEDERIVQLLQGTYINYFHCVQIVEILKETEKDTKNFLGFYSSQRMNDWLNIKSQYEKENVYLAEAAQILQRLVQYDIPALKKQIAKCDSTVADCSRKEEEYAKQAVSSKKQYENELKKMNIEGRHLRRDIESLTADLPAFFERIAQEICRLEEPVEYYKNFRKYVQQGAHLEADLLPLCTSLMTKGSDVTVFEWKHGKKPSLIERLTVMSSAANDQIDEESTKNDDEIDFGDDGEIDFGDGDNSGFGDPYLEGSSAISGAIDGIEVLGDSQADVELLEDAVARGMEALTFLENSETRNLIVDELNELLTFLLFRQDDESTESSANIYISGIENRPAEISNVSVSMMDNWKTEVNDIYARLTDPQKTHLFKIYTSPEYVETILESLERKRSLEDRYEKMRCLMVEKRAEAMCSAGKAQIELNQITEATRTLQQQIEEEISKRYKGTPVNIMGGIVAALKAT